MPGVFSPVRLTLVAVLASTALLYLSQLGWQYLSIEEVSQALQILELTRTGRSVDGQPWPLYFAEPHYPAGRDPLWIYAGAAAAAIVGPSDAALRLPSVVAAMVNVGLFYVLVRQLLGRTGFAAMAAALLALTPAHFLQARLVTSTIGPVPFVLLWLIFLARYMTTRRPRDVVTATAALGISIYSYLAAALFVPFLLLITIVVARRAGVTGRRSWLLAAVALCLTMVPWIAWHIVHTERFAALADYYTRNSYNRDLGLSAFTALDALVSRVDVWWNAFNPDRWFFSGDSNLRFSTRLAGHLLLPLAPFVMIGLLHVARRAALEPLAAALLALIVLAPLPAVLVMDFEIKRWLIAVPVMLLTAVVGLQIVWDSRARHGRAIVIGTFAACVVQFGVFAADYWGPYRGRAGFYFGGNLRAAAAEVLDRQPPPDCVLLDERNLYAALNWRWYAAVRRSPLQDRARLAALADGEWPDGSCRRISVIAPDDSIGRAAVRARYPDASLRVVPIPEPGGLTFLTVYHIERHEAPTP